MDRIDDAVAPLVISEFHRQILSLVKEGHYAEALPLAQKMIADIVSKGEMDGDAATGFDCLAAICKALGDHEVAKANFEHALKIRLRLFGDDHPATAQSFNHKGDILKNEAKYAEAQTFYERAIDIRRQCLGEDHPATLSSIHDLGLLFKDAGDYSSARSLLEQAFKGIQKHHGDEHADTANCRNSLAILFWKTGDYFAAKHELELALAVRRATLGRDHPDTADTLNSLGFLHCELGEYPEALRHLEESLAIKQHVFGNDHPDIAVVLGNSAIVFHHLGNLRQAREYLESALRIYQLVCGEHHLDTAGAHDNLGAFLDDVGEYERARHHLEAGSRIRRKILNDDHPDVLLSLGRLALLYDKTSEYQKSRHLHEQVLVARRRKLGDAHPDTIASYNNLGRCLLALGEYSHARSNLECALKASRRLHGNQHQSVATILNNLGILFGDMGDFNRASKYHAEALDLRSRLLGPHHADTAESLGNLAGVLKELGGSVKARGFYEQALTIYLDSLGDAHPDSASCLTNLGLMLVAMKEFDEAEGHLQRALAIRRRALGEHHSSIANSLHNLGHLRLMRGDVQNAQMFLEQSLKLSKASLDHSGPDMVGTLLNLMCLFAGTGELDKAWHMLQDVVKCDDQILKKVFAIGSNRQRSAVRKMVLNHTEAVLSLISSCLRGQTGAVEFAFDLVLRRKAIGIEALVTQQDARTGNKYPHLKDIFDALLKLKSGIAKAALARDEVKGADASDDRENKWEEELEQLEEELAPQIPEMSLEQKLKSANRHMIVRELNDSTALIEFARCQEYDFKIGLGKGGGWKRERYLVFVVRGGEDNGVELVDLGDASAIDEMVRTFQDILSTPPADRSGTSLKETGDRLRAKVFDPLRHHLNNKTHLILAPDSVLNRLSFAALPLCSDRLMLDDFLISYVSVGRDILRFNIGSIEHSGPAIVVADPAFNLSGRRSESAGVTASPDLEPERNAPDGPNGEYHDAGRNRRFQRLAGSRVEGEYVANLLGVKPLMGIDALDSTVKRARSPGILHLATHGFFLAEPPGSTATSDGFESQERFAGSVPRNPLLRSGLALAGANVWLGEGLVLDEAEDGILTAEDVTEMELSGTELVVLSACDTGLGDLYVGEGVFGLRRAFVLAGAKRLVMTLWKVLDQQTQELMIGFYNRILSGTPVVEALQMAQQAVRMNDPDPYYWAAFILQGDRGRLPTRYITNCHR